MIDASAKELSPEALRFIVTAVKIPVDSPEYAVAVRWVAKRPVTTLDPAQRLMNALGLSLKWQLRIHPYIYWFQPKNPAKYSEQDFEGKSDLELCLMAMDNGETLDLLTLSPEWSEAWFKADRLRMIRAYLWASNPKDKQSLGEFLKRLEAGIPA